MTTVRIEHAVKDFDAWKAAFDSDPADRAGSGVTHYQVFRRADNPLSVIIQLDFGTRAQADAFLTVMDGVWRSPQVASSLEGHPQAIIIESVESKDL
ncbi:MAG: hypothetical protein H7288_23625 [Kineosporiaceae bacterium]|nr:hypothetical protein [Aeromicrobium sp.]